VRDGSVWIQTQIIPRSKGYSMRTVLSIALVVGVMAVFANNSEAQCGPNGCYGSGYGYGAGFFANQFGHRGFITPREQPPYFAQYPPVYYNGIVSRPYGVSPFAVPAGITPVEMTVPPPVSIKNPFFDNPVAPVSEEEQTDDAPAVMQGDGNKVTWQRNPYLDSIASWK